MSRLPQALQPAWPLVKRVHRLATVLMGLLTRRVAPLVGARGLPRGAALTSAETARREPTQVKLHPGGPGEQLRRTSAVGTPALHWIFESARDFDVPDRFVLEIEHGTVVGDYGANLTPGGLLDYETSEYFGIADWREHPIFLRPRLPESEHIDGSVLSLATRGGSANYYHFLLDVLPRWGIFHEVMPDRLPDAVYVPAATAYHKELLALAGLDRLPVIATSKHRAVRAERLLVPSLPNPHEIAPPWMTDWVRAQFPPRDTVGRPRKLFVTRGGGPNTRRLVDEPELWPLLERRGFVRIDPGELSVQEQIDHFAAAETVVAIHGAALTNLVFCRPGVRVLELFAPTYVKHCYWAICENIEDARYRYLLGAGPGRPEGRAMNAIQKDLTIGALRLEAALDELEAG